MLSEADHFRWGGSGCGLSQTSRPTRSLRDLGLTRCAPPRLAWPLHELTRLDARGWTGLSCWAPQALRRRLRHRSTPMPKFIAADAGVYVNLDFVSIIRE